MPNQSLTAEVDGCGPPFLVGIGFRVIDKSCPRVASSANMMTNAGVVPSFKRREGTKDWPEDVELWFMLVLSTSSFSHNLLRRKIHCTISVCNRSTSSHCMGIILSTSSLIFQGPKLAGATSPNATKLCIRRLRLQKLSPLVAT